MPAGGVRVALDVGTGFERDEVNTDLDQYVDLTNNQQHVVVVTRFNKGRGLTIAVK